MSTLTQGKFTGEFLLSEGNGFISRENIVVSSTAPAMVPGTVLGVVTATGEYAPYSNAASDGTEVAKAILYAKADDSVADQKAVAIARYAEVQASELTGLDSAGRADLLAVGIVCR